MIIFFLRIFISFNSGKLFFINRSILGKRTHLVHQPSPLWITVSILGDLNYLQVYYSRFKKKVGYTDLPPSVNPFILPSVRQSVRLCHKYFSSHLSEEQHYKDFLNLVSGLKLVTFTVWCVYKFIIQLFHVYILPLVGTSLLCSSSQIHLDQLNTVFRRWRLSEMVYGALGK